LAKIKKRREQYSDAIKDFILGCLLNIFGKRVCRII